MHGIIVLILAFNSLIATLTSTGVAEFVIHELSVFYTIIAPELNNYKRISPFEIGSFRLTLFIADL